MTDSKNKYLYVLNHGTTNSQNPNSSISAYVIQSTGALAPISDPQNPYPVGNGPVCMVEDPSNQYMYTSNFNDGSVTGKYINSNTGQLSEPGARLGVPGYRETGDVPCRQRKCRLERLDEGTRPPWIRGIGWSLCSVARQSSVVQAVAARMPVQGFRGRIGREVLRIETYGTKALPAWFRTG